MSFDDKLYRRTLAEHYSNRLGWQHETAGQAADIACDVLRQTHGGDRHYIPARKVDHEAIRAAFDGGNYAELSRRYGVSSRHVRRIVDKD